MFGSCINYIFTSTKDSITVNDIKGVSHGHKSHNGLSALPFNSSELFSIFWLIVLDLTLLFWVSAIISQLFFSVRAQLDPLWLLGEHGGAQGSTFCFDFRRTLIIWRIWRSDPKKFWASSTFCRSQYSCFSFFCLWKIAFKVKLCCKKKISGDSFSLTSSRGRDACFLISVGICLLHPPKYLLAFKKTYFFSQKLEIK